MTLRKHLFATALALTAIGTAIPAAQAQNLVVTYTPGSSNGFYTYSYTLTPTANTFVETFSFADSNVNVMSSPSAFFQPTPGIPIFVFTDFIASGTTSVPFVFDSTDAPGSAVGVTANGPGSAGAARSTGPTAAPEPGSLTSMAILSICLGMGIIAKRRKTVFSA